MWSEKKEEKELGGRREGKIGLTQSMSEPVEAAQAQAGVKAAGTWGLSTAQTGLALKDHHFQGNSGE